MITDKVLITRANIKKLVRLSKNVSKNDAVFVEIHKLQDSKEGGYFWLAEPVVSV